MQVALSEPRTHPAPDPAAASVTQLLDGRDCDLRVRTLTTLLAALPPHTNLDIAEYSASIGCTPISASSLNVLKLLNSVAQLLVREHEVIAVLPRRSGPDARLTLFFACNSGSRSDGETTVDEDSSTDTSSTTSDQGCQDTSSKQPPRMASHSVPRSDEDPIAALAQVSDITGLAQYLYDHPQISFVTHVASVEYLLNAIVEAQELLEPPSSRQENRGDEDEMDEEPAIEQIILRRGLLIEYITFHSVSKMRTRFHSVEYKVFLEVMKAITIKDMIAPPQALTDDDYSDLEDILAYMGKGMSFPNLVHSLAPSNPAETAWDLHRLLIASLQLAQEKVEDLYQLRQDHTHNQSTIVTPNQIGKGINAACLHMEFLARLVHDCPCIENHIRSLEHTIRTRIMLDPQKALALLPNTHYDAETDGRLIDSMLEITKAQIEGRFGQQMVCLMVSSQHSLDAITDSSMFPTKAMKFTVCDPEILHEADEISRSGLHDWRKVINSMYLTQPEDTTKTGLPGPTDFDPIYGEEAIQALAELVNFNPGKWANLLASTSSTEYKFRGCCHAEAILATMRFLGACNENTDSNNGTTHSVEIPDEQKGISSLTPHSLHLFKNTYPRIGVSKPCCPVCTKLVSLLQLQQPSGGDTPHLAYTSPTVLSCHNQIYPTALPPYLPVTIAQELLIWLEGLVRAAVEEVVITRRRCNRNIRTASLANSIKSGKGGDSKRKNRAKMGKKSNGGISPWARAPLLYKSALFGLTGKDRLE